MISFQIYLKIGGLIKAAGELMFWMKTGDIISMSKRGEEGLFSLSFLENYRLIQKPL